MIHLGDCLEVLKSLPDNSVDSCVTDPPYGFSFMGKRWDYELPSAEIWKEILRVLKPGAHLLAFGGPRTYHRLACGIEDAGFEIRDQIQWLFGSGFPKSHDVSKAIDKMHGVEREVLDTIPDRWTGKGNALNFKTDRPQEEVSVLGGPKTPDAIKWQGWGTALKPANEPICLARKPLSEDTVAKNVLKWGTGGLNIDGCRIGTDKIESGRAGRSKTESIYKDGLAPQETKHFSQGRFPANLIFSHSEYCTDDQCDIECAIKNLDEQSGVLHSRCNINPTTRGGGMYGHGTFKGVGFSDHAKGQGASRFFYCAKVSSRERNQGCEGLPEHDTYSEAATTPMRDQRDQVKRTNNHPTVKPIKLMSYLCRLVTPPAGVILDPFMGSGSTGIAAHNEGFEFIGIEREEEYFEIAKARIDGSRTL